jgi:cellobiose phosphorylase
VCSSDLERLSDIVVAYEPVWAIGTGKTATAGRAGEVCALIRGQLAELYGQQAALGVRIQYGGSMHAKNAAELLDHLGRVDLSEDVQQVAQPMAGSLDQNCWDGEWYIRAFGAKGRRIGARDNKYGKIFINTQIWAVLAGLDPERQIQALESVKTHLDSPEGPKKCTPAYREIDPNIGLVTRCVWGKKENGAIFGHPTTWLIQAECLLGHGNQAFEYYQKMLPNRMDSDTFFAEPYVYSQYITSNEHETVGRASHSWQTGTAAWMYRVVLDHIFGARLDMKAIIDPVPIRLEGVRMERVFRGTRYLNQ